MTSATQPPPPQPPADRRHRRPGAAPAAPRPPHDRDDAGPAERPARALYLLWADLPTPPGQPGTFDRVGLTMLGIFPFVVMFLVTSIAMLRERTSGTLERLLTTPLSRRDLLLGYGLAFGLAAAVQALVTVAWRRPSTTWTSPGRWLVVLIAVVDAVLGVALGLLASAFARTSSRRCSSCR